MKRHPAGTRALILATVVSLATGALVVAGAHAKDRMPVAQQSLQLSGLATAEFADATVTASSATPPSSSVPTTALDSSSRTTTTTVAVGSSQTTPAAAAGRNSSQTTMTPASSRPTSPPATTAASGASAAKSVGSLPEPSCAQLPAEIPRSGLRGGQWLARRVNGGTADYRMYIEALPCDLYDGESLQMSLYVGGPQATVEYTIDYGDGASWYQPPYEPCHSPMPATFMGPSQHHTYAQAGAYTVRVRISVQPCAAVGTPAAEPQTTSLSIPVQRVVGVR